MAKREKGRSPKGPALSSDRQPWWLSLRIFRVYWNPPMGVSTKSWPPLSVSAVTTTPVS